MGQLGPVGTFLMGQKCPKGTDVIFLTNKELKEVKEIYQNIEIQTDENGTEELGFKKQIL